MRKVQSWFRRKVRNAFVKTQDVAYTLSEDAEASMQTDVVLPLAATVHAGRGVLPDGQSSRVGGYSLGEVAGISGALCFTCNRRFLDVHTRMLHECYEHGADYCKPELGHFPDSKNEAFSLLEAADEKAKERRSGAKVANESQTSCQPQVEATVLQEEREPEISQVQLHRMIDLAVEQFSSSAELPGCRFEVAATWLKEAFPCSTEDRADEPFFSRAQVRKVLALLAEKCGEILAEARFEASAEGTK